MSILGKIEPVIQNVLTEQKNTLRSTIPEMPTPGDPLVAQNARRATAKGRASTILTDTTQYPTHPASAPQVKKPASVRGVPEIATMFGGIKTAFKGYR